jgi:hypothetical protein
MAVAFAIEFQPAFATGTARWFVGDCETGAEVLVV